MRRRSWSEPPKASLQMAVIMVVGIAVGVPATFVLSPLLGPLIGWDTTAALYLLWAWRVLWFRDSRQTAELAVREDPSRPVRDTVLVGAGLASLLAIGILLATEHEVGGISRELHIGLGIVSVLLSWAVVHFVFAARYARLYYAGGDGGVDFHEEAPPKYSDFAYMSFTIGMTFQVADVALTTKTMRATVLKHALVSYLFGAVIIAATLNLLAGLVR